MLNFFEISISFFLLEAKFVFLREKEGREKEKKEKEEVKHIF